MRLNFSLFGRELGVIFSFRKKRDKPVSGITNRTNDGHYIVFLDYDNLPLSWVLPEIGSIQEEFDLSDMFVFNSSEDSYHVVCFDKLTRQEYEAVLYRSSCDPYYKKIPFVWGKRLNTLRVSAKVGRKPSWTTVLRRSPANVREQSSAHRAFFLGQYSLDLQSAPEDGEDELIIASYRI